MRRHISFLATIATFIAALAGASSVAHAGGDERAPAPTSRTGSASAWRSIAYDDALTTARCVGDPRTPVCAVETVFACLVRRGDLCRKVIETPEDAETYARQRPHFYDIVWYRVIKAWRVPPPEDWALKGYPVGPYKPRRGDRHVVIHRMKCRIDFPRCNLDRPETMRFLLRHVGQEWKAIGWTTDRLD